MCKSTLGLSWNAPNTIQMLAMHFECPDLLPKAQHILEQYRTKYYTQLPILQQQCIHLEDAIYQGAAFWNAACELKVSISLYAMLLFLYIILMMHV